MGKLKRKEKHEAELSQLEKDIDARCSRSMMFDLDRRQTCGLNEPF